MFATIDSSVLLWLLLCLAAYKIRQLLGQAKAFGERNPEVRDAATRGVVHLLKKWF
jgi:hypothetical protein